MLLKPNWVNYDTQAFRLLLKGEKGLSTREPILYSSHFSLISVALNWCPGKLKLTKSSLNLPDVSTNNT